MQKKGTKFWGKCVRVGEKAAVKSLKLRKRKEQNRKEKKRKEKEKTSKRLASKKQRLLDFPMHKKETRRHAHFAN